jgi:hypothetical protein
MLLIPETKTLTSSVKMDAAVVDYPGHQRYLIDPNVLAG